MPNQCIVTGKKTQVGNNVSHSVRRTKRKFRPNLQKKKVLINGVLKTVKISTRGLRTLIKKGGKLVTK